MPTALTWTGNDDDTRAASSHRVPDGMTNAYYWLQEDRFRPYGPDNRAAPWHLMLIGVDRHGHTHGEVDLGHHATPDGAKAAAAKYEETGTFSLAACLPDQSVVATSNAAYIKTNPSTTAAWRSTWGGFHSNQEVDKILAGGGGGHVLRVGPAQRAT